jgi:hypothetical protein
MSSQFVGQFFWQIDGLEIAGHIIRKSLPIGLDDAKTIALPENASSGVLRVEGGEEYPVPPRDLFAITDTQLRDDEGKRRDLILWLRAKAFWALVGAGIAPGTALGYGQQFVGRYGRELEAYILGSAPDFRAAMVEAPETWLDTDTEVSPRQTIRQLFLDSVPEGSVPPTRPNLLSQAEYDSIVEEMEGTLSMGKLKNALMELLNRLRPG